MESPGQEAAREDGGAAALRREICHINHRGNLLALIGVQAQMYVVTLRIGSFGQLRRDHSTVVASFGRAAYEYSSDRSRPKSVALMPFRKFVPASC